MAIRRQLYTLPLGTILTDQISGTKYILLETKYKVTGNRTSDGVLLGFYSNDSATYFTNQIFETDTLGNLYNSSRIKKWLCDEGGYNQITPHFKTSERLKEYIMPTMICGANTIYDLIGPMRLFLPSGIELGNIGTNIAGVVIDTTTPIINTYIQHLKTAKVLTRNTDGFNVQLADESYVSMSTPQNLSYFLVVDPTIYVGMDENDNYYLFDNFVNSTIELENAIFEAQNIIDTYEDIIELKPFIDNLKNIVTIGLQNINDGANQETINQINHDLLDLIKLVEIQIKIYEINLNRINENINGINTIIEAVNNFIQVLTINGNINNITIADDLTSLNILKNNLNTKITNLTSKIESPMDIVNLGNYLQNNFDILFSIQNSINQKLIINISNNEVIQQLLNLIQDCINLISEYPLVDKYYLELSINNSNLLLVTPSPSISDIQQSILELSERKQQFINSIKFESDVENVVLEIGLLGRRPTFGLKIENNTGIDVIATSSNNDIVIIGSPIVISTISPIGIVKQYPIIGIDEGTAQITFQISADGINKNIIIPVVVSKKDTVDPGYLDLIEDNAKISIQQIDSGIKDMGHLGVRLEDIEKKLFSSSSTLDPNLLNILNTTTPTPIVNNIEMIIIKDANITTNIPTIVSLQNHYYMGKQHLVVYRNGVYQQLDVKYKETTSNSVTFDANYLVPGDKLIFITSKNGISDLSQILVEYDISGLITKIKFMNNIITVREMEFKYNDKLQITEQIISDALYKFTKIFTYNDDGLVTDIDISMIKI